MENLVPPPASPLSAADWATVGIALVALAASIYSLMIAKSAQRLAKDQEERQGLAFEVSLHEALSISTVEGRYLSCAVLVTNPSDSPNTIVTAELHIGISGADGFEAHIKIRPVAPAASQALGMGSQHQLSIPLTVQPRSAVSGRVMFLVPDAISEGRRINSYEFAIRDVHHRSDAFEIVVFRDVVDAE